MFLFGWSSKSHEISGKKPLEHWRPLLLPTVVIMLADRILAKGVTKHIPRYTNHQCERVDYNLIIGFSLSFSGDADAAVVTLNLLL